MAGSIQDRGNGNYFLTVSNGFDSNGKRIRKTRSIKAKGITEAREKLAAFVTEVKQGEYVAPSHIKLKDYVPIWMNERSKKIAPSTIETYGYALNGRILPSIGHLKMEAIKTIHITNYIYELEEEGLSSSYVVKHYNILNSIFKLAVKNDVLKRNPIDKVDRPSVSYKPGDVYDSEELKDLYHLLNKEDNKQMVLIVKLALLTGMRKGEILAVQWYDVDFTTNTIHIRHSLSYTGKLGYLLKEPKTKGSIRKVAPPKKFMTELKKHIFSKKTDRMEAEELWKGGKYCFVFSSDMGKPIFPGVPNLWWNRFLDRTGFKKIRFHDLRHTAATTLINKNANIHSISKRL